MILELITAIVGILPKTRKSNPVSKLIRPFFEKRKFKSYFGAQIAGLAAVLSVVTYPAQAFDYSEVPTYVDGGQVEKISTEDTFEFPLQEYYGVSQGYTKYHLGYDIRAPKGADLYPVEAGEVIEVRYQKYGYGHYVRIAHERGFESLYAHMGEIWVEEGQIVERGMAIGEIGMTGWTTGPHLHFELKQDGKFINPGLIF